MRKLVCMGEEVTLLAERAVLWASARTLIIADPHFGKDSTFRAAGVPVPGGATEADLQTLAAMVRNPLPPGEGGEQVAFDVSFDSIEPGEGRRGGQGGASVKIAGRGVAARAKHQTGRSSPHPSPLPEGEGVRRLIILGDFFHTAHSQCVATLAALRAWREQHTALEIVLIRGNHDAHAGDPPKDLRIECVDEPWNDGPFVFSHKGVDPGEKYGMSGHIHPAASLSGAGESLRAPCFWFNDWGVVLPAFGRFTGGYSIRPREGDRVFVIGEGEVMEATVPKRRGS